ncbi:MAG: MFS transporter [Candidatus Bathyarchaeia archaeon]
MIREAPSKKVAPKRLFVPSLALAAFTEQNMDLLVSLFLIDIALTFQVTAGTASQMVAISKMAAVITGLLISVLSVRFRHKSLLLVGSLVIILGLLGCVLAPSFAFMEIFYPLDGVGSIMVVAMSMSLMGEFLSLDRRPKAIGWFNAAGTLTWFVGAPVAGLLTGIGGWRSVILLFFLPLSVAGLVLTYFSVPSMSRKHEPPVGREAYLSSFKQVFLNRSAAACLIGGMLFMASHVWGIYGITFYRQQFSVPVEYAAFIIVGTTTFGAFGNVIGGRLVNRVGRKRLTVLTLGFASMLVAVLVYVPNVWLALSISFLNAWLRQVGFTAIYSLNLEQAPKSRGTMMSISGVLNALGAAFGAALGGPVLDLFGFQILGPTLAALGLASVSVYHFWAKDPCKT